MEVDEDCARAMPIYRKRHRHRQEEEEATCLLLLRAAAFENGSVAAPESLESAVDELLLSLWGWGEGMVAGLL